MGLPCGKKYHVKILDARNIELTAKITGNPKGPSAPSGALICYHDYEVFINLHTGVYLEDTERDEV